VKREPAVESGARLPAHDHLESIRTLYSKFCPDSLKTGRA